ncbi:hypothetical protein O6H91_Y258900 [Diphasiastrum complanatum]|nr:hypothetical protein O6H91_Y258900 [Diphasiastrum complanatum]KAJ7294408.1 hypothetical protein O6H91_Y258900 [Diphasiastrum complanatum]
MINAGDLYKVLSAVVPLYVAMFLAYGSVRWWKILTPDQCGGINRFVAIFAVPFLSFHIIASNDPYKMNAKFIAADTIQKIAILFVLVIWAKYWRRGSLEWTITTFMLATLPNTLVMGIPLLAAMYGKDSGSLVVQAVVLQCIIWYTLLLFLYEFRSARLLICEQFPDTAASIVSFKVDSDVTSLDGREPLQTEAEIRNDGKIHVIVRKSTSSRSHSIISPRRSSTGMASIPSFTPRHSNLTGAEIYSISSSRNLTPRESSFSPADFSSTMMHPLPVSPRQSNLTASDDYSLHSSKAPTPRSSNFTEENSKDMHVSEKGLNPIASPRFSIRPYRGQNAGWFAAGRSHNGGGGSITGIDRAAGGIFSPRRASQASKKMRSDLAMRVNAAPKQEDEEAIKELHMFVWSSSASPVSEGGIIAFGGSHFNTADASSALDHDPKEVRVQVGHTNQSKLNAPRESVEAAIEEIDRDDFSFGNPASFRDEQSAGRLTKVGSSSTAQLTPRLPPDQQYSNSTLPPATVMIRLILDMVWRKLIRNPNTYSSLLGLIWALVSYRWHKVMPLILEKSIEIISNAGLGMAMFSLGLFMALQKRLLACGTWLALFGMLVRFFAGPAVMAAASVAVGLRGVSLHVSIVQASLPQGIVPFVFAKEYNVHPDVLSTAVIFGMLVALPINLVYYILLGL